jgi:hypothetical protein
MILPDYWQEFEPSEIMAPMAFTGSQHGIDRILLNLPFKIKLMDLVTSVVNGKKYINITHREKSHEQLP